MYKVGVLVRFLMYLNTLILLISEKIIIFILFSDAPPPPYLNPTKPEVMAAPSYSGMAQTYPQQLGYGNTVVTQPMYGVQQLQPQMQYVETGGQPFRQQPMIIIQQSPGVVVPMHQGATNEQVLWIVICCILCWPIGAILCCMWCC